MTQDQSEKHEQEATIVEIASPSTFSYKGISRGIRRMIFGTKTYESWSMVKLSQAESDLVQVVFPTAIADEFRDFFIQSSTFWNSVIGDTSLNPISFESDVNVNQLGSCNNGAEFILPANTPLNILILAEVTAIDGGGNILAQAGPCGASGNFPRIGRMRFDEADLSSINSDGTFDEVIKHEMGHVLGIGTFWGDLVRDPCINFSPCDGDPHYTGANGISGFEDLQGSGDVPVENTRAQGTANSHWRESVFERELMTGFIDGGPDPHPFSILSAKSLLDLGYTVDLSTAEEYSINPAVLTDKPTSAPTSSPSKASSTPSPSSDSSQPTISPTKEGIDIGDDVDPTPPEEITPTQEFFAEWQDFIVIFSIIFVIVGVIVAIVLITRPCKKKKQQRSNLAQPANQNIVKVIV